MIGNCVETPVDKGKIKFFVSELKGSFYKIGEEQDEMPQAHMEMKEGQDEMHQRQDEMRQGHIETNQGEDDLKQRQDEMTKGLHLGHF